MQLQAVNVVGVIGAGQMGSGIAQVMAAAGYRVLLADVSRDVAARGKKYIGDRMERAVAKGKLEAGEKDALLARVEPIDQDAVEAADIVVEAAVENLELKLELFRKLDAKLKPDALLLTNTSSLSITRLGAATSRPSQVAGMHFMNPVPLMKLVEAVRGLETSKATLELVVALAERLGKTVIVSEDRPGFVVNRILLPLVNEACFALQERLASAEHIDTGVRLGLNHPMGPLELADLIGLDTVLSIAEILQRELGEDKYRPAPLLRNLVAAGFLGRKAGRGFYRYDAAGKKLDAS
ncbi:MAG TPA: 3-hydroxyacyl-CoA dehydrogenase NAD-binding domain-containing protein [Polyangiaceae bacterium]